MIFRQLASAVCFACLTLAATPVLGAEGWEFQTVEGERYTPFDDEPAKLLVVVFISTDCPVANYFQPTLKRLAKKHGAGGVEFMMVHSDPSVDAAAARTHAGEFAIEAPVVLDPEFALARRLSAEYTPEAVVLDRDRKVRYRGRVNDMYVEWGKKRRAPKREDLDIAITELLKGGVVSVPKTKPVGCYIPYPNPAQSGSKK